MNQQGRPWVLVTGASSGIGRAIALRLFEDGFDLALLGRRSSALEEVLSDGVADGGSGLIVPCDLLDRGRTDQAIKKLLAVCPRFFGVVLNAGEAGLSPLEEPGAAHYRRFLELNLVAPMRLLRHLVPVLEDGGRVVGIGSVLGRFGIPQGHGYCAGKAGLAGLLRALALDLAPRRIAVNTIQPGWVDTEMARNSIASQAPLMGMSAEEGRKFFESQLPLGRFLLPGEVAAYVAFLFSPAAHLLTGEAMNICGGALA